MGRRKVYEVQALVVNNWVDLVEHCSYHSKLEKLVVTLVHGSVLNAGLGSVVDCQEGRHSGDLWQTCCSCPTVLTDGVMT